MNHDTLKDNNNKNNEYTPIFPRYSSNCQWNQSGLVNETNENQSVNRLISRTKRLPSVSGSHLFGKSLCLKRRPSLISMESLYKPVYSQVRQNQWSSSLDCFTAYQNAFRTTRKHSSIPCDIFSLYNLQTSKLLCSLIMPGFTILLTCQNEVSKKRTSPKNKLALLYNSLIMFYHSGCDALASVLISLNCEEMLNILLKSLALVAPGYFCSLNLLLSSNVWDWIA